MKALNWIAWISGGIGLILMILGGIQFLFGKCMPGEHIVSYFTVANSFFLIAVILMVYIFRCTCNKD